MRMEARLMPSISSGQRATGESGPRRSLYLFILFVRARALPRILSHEIGNLAICVIDFWLGSRLKVSQNNEPDAVRMCGSGKM